MPRHLIGNNAKMKRPRVNLVEHRQHAACFLRLQHFKARIGISKEVVYALLDVPDYQSFITDYKVFHYVEKGLELYFPDRNVGIMSFIPPEKFKGVTYVTTLENMSKNVVVNVTEPVEIK